MLFKVLASPLLRGSHLIRVDSVGDSDLLLQLSHLGIDDGRLYPFSLADLKILKRVNLIDIIALFDLEGD